LTSPTDGRMVMTVWHGLAPRAGSQPRTDRGGRHSDPARRQDGPSSLPDRRTPEAQIDDTGMRVALDEDEFAEVAVIGDQNLTFPCRNGQDLGIGQTARVVDGNPCRVVTLRPQIGYQAGIGTLVEEKLHPWLAPTGPDSRRRVRWWFPSTATQAY
jgi:hypothetical protein